MINKNHNKIFWLEEFDSFLLDGKDSKRFLNGVTTTNINLEKDVLKTCWLNPAGNLKSLLEIHCEGNKLKVLILQGNINEIKKYFEDMIFPSDDISISNTIKIFRLQEINKDNSWRVYPVKLFSKNNFEKFCNQNKFKMLDFNELKEWKINQALPIFNYEIDGKNNPLELGLTDLVDFNKGCYLGQETMARLKKVSSLTKEIRQWKSFKLINNKKLNNKKVFLNEDKDKIVGYITSYFYSNLRQYIGLCMIKKNFLDKNNSFFTEDFGVINIVKSKFSVFL